MLSRRLRMIFGYRVWLGNVFGCSPYTYDRKSQKLVPTGKYLYVPWIILSCVVFILEGALAVRTIARLWEDDMQVLHFLVDIVSVGGIWIAIIPTYQILVGREDWAAWVNHVLTLDGQLQETFKSEIKNLTKKQKLVVLCLEGLQAIIALGTLEFPVILGILLFEEFMPLHRLIEQAFQVEIVFNLNYIMVALVMTFVFEILANTVCLMLSAGLNHMVVTIFWPQLICPEETKMENGKPKAIVGLPTNKIIEVYQQLGILDRICNTILCGQLMTSHHLVDMVLNFLCLYTALEHYAVIPFTGVLGCYVTSAIFTSVIYCESKMVSKGATESENVLMVCKNAHKRKSIEYKILRSLKPLRLEVGAPYFYVDSEYFLTYMKNVMDNLINLLML